ncbi:MAG: hypothetical protein IJ416_05700 [Ruminiclostridium sp.]|nr:hypothetical protein [Ruminiclostridium sp.]
MRRKFAVIVLAFSFMMAGGCVSIADRTLPERPAIATVSETVDIPDTPVTVSVATTTAPQSEGITAETTTNIPIEEIYGNFEFSEEDYGFLEGCVFVGDSICSGLGHYNIIPAANVIAQGNIAARNIFDFTFTVDGGELSLIPALVNSSPECVVFSMGINDINITSEQEFADNYAEILRMTEGFLPEAQLIVLSITPIDAGSTFAANEKIDGFNEALRKMVEENERWLYVDVTPELKNSENALKTAYSSGDGIHLSPDAYHAVLYQLCRTYLGDEEEGTETTEPPADDIVIELE